MLPVPVIALVLSERREALVRSMIEAANITPGMLSATWQFGEEAYADVVVREVASDSGMDLLHVEIGTGAVDRQVLPLAWPVRSTALFALLNDATGRMPAPLPHRTPTRTAATDFAQIANDLLESWLVQRAQGAMRIMLHTHHRPFALLDLAMDAYFVPEHASDTTSVQLALRACHGSPEWHLHDELPPRWKRGGAARQLLWDFAGIGARSGLLPTVAKPSAVRLRGWPYPITRGPAIWGSLAMKLKDGPLTVAQLSERVSASPSELAQFLNGCVAAGFVRTEAANNAGASVAVTHAASAEKVPGPLKRALTSIRLALGLTARHGEEV